MLWLMTSVNRYLDAIIYSVSCIRTDLMSVGISNYCEFLDYSRLNACYC
jgi:hypothetical protein